MGYLNFGLPLLCLVKLSTSILFKSSVSFEFVKKYEIVYDELLFITEIKKKLYIYQINNLFSILYYCYYFILPLFL